jgi:integrase
MGVRVREKPKGSGVWWLFIDHHSRRKAKRVGKGKEGRKAADLAALKIRAALVSGDTQALSESAPAVVMRFKEYAATWLTQSIGPHRKERTTGYYQQIIDNHLAPTFDPLPLIDIKPAHVRAFVAEKLNGRACSEHEQPARTCRVCVGTRSKNTVKNMVATLRAILYQAQVDDLIPSNPAARFGRFFDARHDPREHVTVLDAGDVATVFQAATKWYPDHELAVRVLFQTGMREGELLGLQWDDIDWPRNLIDLRRTVAVRGGRWIVNTPKSGKLRTVDLPAVLTGRLRELYSIRQAEAAVAGKEMSRWVFPSATDPGKPLNDAWLRDRVWRPLLVKAGVRHVRVHDARHTYASLMLRRGVPIVYVSRQLGHSSIQVTVDLYGTFVPGADRHHVEALAEAIEEAGRQPNATPAQPLPAEADARRSK